MITLHDLTIKKIHNLLLNKEVCSFDLTKEFFDYIEKKDRNIDAYLSLLKEEALKQANEVDRKIAAGENIPILAGVPLAIKDNILIRDTITTAGSKILKDYKATYDATVIKKLKKQLAIFLGKTNLDEFAMGSSTETSAFKLTRNPLDEERVPGGSSGGSAAAVAAHEAVAALGSDTGGSVRQPASFCGLVGLKPTYGAVSRFGLIAMASSLDQIGPITKNVEDAALLLEAICGKDKFDNTTENFSFDAQSIYERKDLKNLKIGIIKEIDLTQFDANLAEIFQKSLSLLKELGAEIKEISIPHVNLSLACYYVLMPAEVSSNLARFDGLRYSPSEESGILKDLYFKTRGKLFGQEVRRRILLGTFVLSSGYYEAYYKKARLIQALIKKEFENIFKEVDLVVLPTTPTPAFKIGEKTSNPLEMYLSDIFTVPANIAGIPAISLPLWSSKNKLPYGLQFFGKHFEEPLILNAAYLFEQNSNYGRFY
ncbi:MAG: Asp-tRNA(Asn)/Glu-tRNA(Gln) amidotransferase subunit GatA [Patescibacteria group bacterium]|jgi:aspartyl-tRNA(Asn)/glutamyl-tRNA(Gln) amidotransferase subunit A|nr:Asp-tRNA(Asn)/Glu-tRNA(Gln) amidotransferase subunit GatA [Patescibacteria group bacterium]